MNVSEKGIIGCTALLCLTGLQLYAWASGHNGIVFATISAIFGAVVGSYFDIKQKIGGLLKNDNE